jgi:hypothetical protein
MICDKCGQELESIVCGNCGQAVLKLGPYCYACGKIIDSKVENAAENEESAEEIDFSDRILCSDGTCIGIVEKGVCKLCGKPYVPEPDQQ